MAKADLKSYKEVCKLCTSCFCIIFLIEAAIWEMLFCHQLLQFLRYFIPSWVIIKSRGNVCKVSTAAVMTIMSKINLVLLRAYYYYWILLDIRRDRCYFKLFIILALLILTKSQCTTITADL